MNIQQLIFLFYLMFTLYSILLLGFTDIGSTMFLSSLILMWILFASFYLGSKFKVKPVKYALKTNDFDIPSSLMFTACIISVISSIVSMKYYTGNSPIEVYQKLKLGISVYNEYQQFFTNENLNVFSVRKLPYILMLYLTKLTFLYFTIYLLLIRKTKRKVDYFLLGVIALSHIYIGISRGTSFEIFELIILYTYIIFNRVKKIRISFKKILVILLMIITGVFLFLNRIEARGYKFDLYSSMQEVNFSSNGWLSSIFPFISSVLYKMYGYFGFGFYYMYVFINEVWFKNLSSILYGLFPRGLSTYYGESLEKIMIKHVDVGVKWHPDIINMIDYLGLLGSLIIIFLFSLLVKVLITKSELHVLKHLVCFFVLLQMISLPIGSFVMNTSSNQLVIISIIITWGLHLFSRKRVVIR